MEDAERADEGEQQPGGDPPVVVATAACDEEHPEHRDSHGDGICPHTDEHAQDRHDATTHRPGMSDEGETDQNGHDDEHHAPDVVGLSPEPVADPFPKRHEQGGGSPSHRLLGNRARPGLAFGGHPTPPRYAPAGGCPLGHWGKD